MLRVIQTPLKSTAKASFTHVKGCGIWPTAALYRQTLKFSVYRVIVLESMAEHGEENRTDVPGEGKGCVTLM